MVASATTRSVFFKHVCGVVKLKLAGPEFGQVKKITMTTTEDAPLSGTGRVNLDFNLYEDPQFTFGDEPSESVTVDCADNPIEITMGGSFFHFVVAPGTYETLVFTIENTDGKVFESRTKEPLTVKRGQIADAGLAHIYIESYSMARPTVSSMPNRAPIRSTYRPTSQPIRMAMHMSSTHAMIWFWPPRPTCCGRAPKA